MWRRWKRKLIVCPAGSIKKIRGLTGATNLCPWGRTWGDETKYWKFSWHCQWLPVDNKIALEYIFRAMYYEPIKPGQSSQTYLLDLNNSNGCPGHPNGVHLYSDADICYYTMQNSNQTQGKGMIWHWDLDPYRTGKLWWMIRTVFPHSIILTNKGIKQQVERVMEIPDKIQGDTHPNYHHDLHMHVYMRTTINPF